MKTRSASRYPALFAAACLIASIALPMAGGSALPPLNQPATSEHRPGKLVWADLFTTDAAAATAFYSSLLGWTSETLGSKGRNYVVLSNGGVPVAGISQRSVKTPGHPSRWIGYLAVTDAAASVSAAVKDGGKVRAPSRSFPDRGYQAIVADSDGNPIGLLQSSTGDPADGDPKPGAWNWFEVYAKSPKVSSDFYHDVFGLAVATELDASRSSEFTLSSEGRARGGVAPMPSGEDVKPSWLGVIRVADLDKTLAKVPVLGGEILVSPHAVEFGSRFAIILDPTGGTLGLVEYIDSANPANNP